MFDSEYLMQSSAVGTLAHLDILHVGNISFSKHHIGVKAMNRTRWILGTLVVVGIVIMLVLVASGGLNGYACNNFC